MFNLRCGQDSCVFKLRQKYRNIFDKLIRFSSESLYKLCTFKIGLNAYDYFFNLPYRQDGRVKILQQRLNLVEKPEVGEVLAPTRFKFKEILWNPS